MAAYAELLNLQSWQAVRGTHYSITKFNSTVVQQCWPVTRYYVVCVYGVYMRHASTDMCCPSFPAQHLLLGYGINGPCFICNCITALPQEYLTGQGPLQHGKWVSYPDLITANLPQ